MKRFSLFAVTIFVLGLTSSAEAQFDYGESGDSPLPVALSSFAVLGGDAHVILHWVTEDEIDNLGFHVYRSLDEEGVYERVTSQVVEGAGTATERREYVFTDMRLTNGVTYWYKLEDVAFDGTRTMHGPISVTPQAKAEAVAARPEAYALAQCYPNPFNPVTEIRYQLPEPSDVKLAIYDLLGQEVRALVSKTQAAGWYRVTWDGSGFATGIYLYRLETGNFTETRKALLLR